MARAAALSTADFRQALLETYAVNDRMSQLILEHLDPQAWRAKPPGRNARTIAAMFAHMHNIRRKWLRLSAPHLKLPAQLDRTRCTQHQAAAALGESALRCSEMLADALDGSAGRVERFQRDGWARPWPGGAAMFAYMIVHDAHHRGQACMLAHQLGFPLPMKASYGMVLGKTLEGVRIHWSAVNCQVAPKRIARVPAEGHAGEIHFVKLLGPEVLAKLAGNKPDRLRELWCEQVRVARQEPATVRLLAEKAHGVAARSRRFPVAASDRNCEARARACVVADDDALLKAGIRFHARTLHGTLPRGLEFFLPKGRLTGHQEDDVLCQHREHGVHVAGSRGAQPLIQPFANALIVIHTMRWYTEGAGIWVPEWDRQGLARRSINRLPRDRWPGRGRSTAHGKTSSAPVQTAGTAGKPKELSCHKTSWSQPTGGR